MRGLCDCDAAEVVKFIVILVVADSRWSVKEFVAAHELIYLSKSVYFTNSTKAPRPAGPISLMPASDSHPTAREVSLPGCSEASSGAKRRQEGTPLKMLTEDLRFESRETVRQYVHQVLCQTENLEPDCFPLSERELARPNGHCGTLFCLHGPRQLQLTAIWEVDRNVVWFYNAVGERFRKTRLQTVAEPHHAGAA